MIKITSHAEGWLIAVRAQPGAKKNAALGEHDGALKIAITAPAIEGQANKALIDTLRKLLDVKRSQVELASGTKSREKRILIRGLSQVELEERLARLIE